MDKYRSYAYIATSQRLLENCTNGGKLVCPHIEYFCHIYRALVRSKSLGGTSRKIDPKIPKICFLLYFQLTLTMFRNMEKHVPSQPPSYKGLSHGSHKGQQKSGGSQVLKLTLKSLKFRFSMHFQLIILLRIKQ